MFDSYALKKQKFLDTDEQVEKVAALVPDENILSFIISSLLFSTCIIVL